MTDRLNFDPYGFACKLLAAAMQLKKGATGRRSAEDEAADTQKGFLRPRSLGRRDWLRDGTGVYRETKVRREATPPPPPLILPAFVTQSLGLLIYLCSLLHSRKVHSCEAGEISQ